MKTVLTAILLIPVLLLVLLSGCSKDTSTEPSTPTPAAPSALTATQISFAAIQVSWTDNSSNEDSFVVRRTVDTNTFVWPVIAVVLPNITSIRDTVFQPVARYYYRVTAANQYGTSGPSNTAPILTWESMPPPTDLDIHQVHPGYVTLTWIDRSTNEDSFHVERTETLGSTDWPVLLAVGENDTFAVDSTIALDRTYYYRVRPINANAPGFASAVDSIHTLAGLPAPTGLTVTQTQRPVLALSWTRPANVDTIVLERSTDSTNWSVITTGIGQATSFADSAISANQRFFFRAQSRDGSYYSPYSNSASIWTWPAVFDFSSASDLGEYAASGLAGTPQPPWEWDTPQQAGKITIVHPISGGGLVSLISTYTMPNSGWFECKFKVDQWFGIGPLANYAQFYLERSPGDSDNVVTVIFKQDSTILGYYSTTDGQAGELIVLASFSGVTAQAWHRLQFFHSGYHWDFFIDGVRRWGTANRALINATTTLYEEWQFSQGNGPNNQEFWVDDWANNSSTP